MDPQSVQEITFERTRCKGFCPAYTVTFMATGEAMYVGTVHVDRMGRHHGALSSRSQFARLARFVTEIGFDRLDGEYRSDRTDQPSAVVTVRGDAGGWRVRNEASAGPIVVWALALVIDRLADEVRWEATAG